MKRILSELANRLPSALFERGPGTRLWRWLNSALLVFIAAAESRQEVAVTAERAAVTGPRARPLAGRSHRLFAVCVPLHSAPPFCRHGDGLSRCIPPRCLPRSVLLAAIWSATYSHRLSLSLCAVRLLFHTFIQPRSQDSEA